MGSTHTQQLTAQLRARMRGAVEADYVLAPHTSYSLGGPADLALLPLDAQDLACGVSLLAAAGVPFEVLGGGSNVLVSDHGVRGAVVLTAAMTTLQVRDAAVQVGAGVPSHRVAEAARDAGLTGAEFLTCLPGSVGGACFMNARAYGGEVAGVLSGATTVTRAGALRQTRPVPGDFAYKRSPFQLSQEILARVELSLQPGRQDQITARMDRIAQARQAKHELDHPSCGCVFKNDRCIGSPSGQLIERCGLKGYGEGGAKISPHHANFVIAVGPTTAAEVRRVMEHMRATVAQQLGHALEFEVQFIGQW